MLATRQHVDVPKISILMATWNCSPLLTSFLSSLECQTVRDWELLILDNRSADGLTELVQKYHAAHPDQMIRLNIALDTGIYDAWNKGIELARGEYITFIGADDIFANSESLNRLLSLAESSCDLITCRNSYYALDGRFLRDWGSPWCWRRMRESMNIAHPGMLVRRELFTQYGLFDTTFKICGDYEWFLRLPAALTTIHSQDSILKITQGGVSHTKIREVYAETFQAQRRHLNILWSAGCWLLNWLKYCRRRLIGLT